MASLAGHLLRRGLEQMPATAEINFDGQPATFSAGHNQPELHIPLYAIVLGGLILAITSIMCLSIDYTIGDLMVSLAMIESPSSTTTLLDPKAAPPAYTEEPDAPLEKREQEYLHDDIAIMTIEKSVPITAHATYKFLAHLRSVGGFYARWRGLVQYIVYNVSVNILAHLNGFVLGMALGRHAGQAIGLILAVVGTCRLHMLWTHAMIGSPTSTPWYKRFTPRKQCKVLLLPSLVYALAQQLTVILPIGVAFALHLDTLHHPERMEEIKHITNGEVIALMLRVLAVPATYILVLFTVLLPAKASLIRIEAALLPEEQETIVSFDKEAIIGDIDITQRGSSKKLFAAAWKSFSGPARRRVAMVCFKSVFYQLYVFFLGFTIAATVVYLCARTEIRKYIHDIQQQ